ncbi:ATP synthase subunit b [Dissostichus eleginoides]|uniref:ATP synthase subunit b n=1 Tax=Dissostichus eleginoides TaxID=100907 RepID=A0AAD9BLA5_DISEL|nr:ATP synthase subunit b [Dissostichus eleginoides]
MSVNIIRTTLGVLMLIPVFLLILWMRKKKALRSTTEAHEPEDIELDSIPEYENISHTAAKREDTEEQETWCEVQSDAHLMETKKKDVEMSLWRVQGSNLRVLM